MKQQVLFFFFTLMLTGISVSAQTGGGRIAGVVIDNAGEEPLPGATIFIEELKKGIVTDGHGEFLLSDVPAATYTLTVRFIGYHTQTRKLTVGKERGKKIIIRLKAEAKSLDEVVVMGKSEARKLREQAMPISVISMNQIQGTVNNVQDILAKTAGITVRATGGTGSTSRMPASPVRSISPTIQKIRRTEGFPLPSSVLPVSEGSPPQCAAPLLPPSKKSRILSPLTPFRNPRSRRSP